jgi:hypothetical protein
MEFQGNKLDIYSNDRQPWEYDNSAFSVTGFALWKEKNGE